MSTLLSEIIPHLLIYYNVSPLYSQRLNAFGPTPSSVLIPGPGGEERFFRTPGRKFVLQPAGFNQGFSEALRSGLLWRKDTGCSEENSFPPGNPAGENCRWAPLRFLKESPDGCFVLHHWESRQAFQESFPVVFCSEPRVEDGHDSPVLGCADQPAQPLLQQDNG